MMAEYYTLPDQGWSWIVLLASFGSHCIHGFFLTAVGLLQLSLLDHYKENVFKTSLALSIFLGLFSTSGILASVIVNRWSCRVSIMTGGLIVSISHVVTAFIPNITLVIISLGIFGGIGIGMCYASSLVVVGYNFEKKRNIASGLAVSGAGIGAFALAPLMQTASDYFGYHGLWLMCAGLTLQYCLFGSLCFPSKLEFDRRIELKNLTRSASDSDVNRKHKLKRLREIFRVSSQRTLICVYLSMLLCNLGIYLLFLHFGSYVTSVGFSKLDAAFLYSICGICNCISRILVGSAANASNIDEFIMFGGTFSLAGISTALFPLYGQSYSGQVIYMVMLGMYSGCCYALLNSICVNLAGIEHLATVYGFILFFTGMGCFVGPLLGGMIVDYGGTYGQSIAVAGILIFVGSLFAWASGAGERRGSHTKDTEKTIPDQENKCSILGTEKEEHLFRNKNTDYVKTKTVDRDQEFQCYGSEKPNTEVSEMENLRKVTELEMHSLL
ncbi:monocarboxylate transporter 14-like isoform X1 [Ostrea edulis]|uniref:monocarboxylate transporter 14-like isoform X1 n=1 Tax=Ostrea edulis TaxID=37623 RepID=UPI0024AF3B0D|nr:monocarboxylate transporter 14-like isoform X1 [Ostrea edulis]XP_048745803.2 monocarboxylate transporter 14-like isoform X1 [Ostrea edulis]